MRRRAPPATDARLAAVPARGVNRPASRGRTGAVARPPDVATCSARATRRRPWAPGSPRPRPYGPPAPPVRSRAPRSPSASERGLSGRTDAALPDPPDALRRPAPVWRIHTRPRPPMPVRGAQPPRRLLSVTIRPARCARPPEPPARSASPYRRTRPAPGARPPESRARRPDGPADGAPPGSTGPPRPRPPRSPPRPPPKPLTAAPRGPRSRTRQARRQASRPSVDMDLGERRRTV